MTPAQIVSALRTKAQKTTEEAADQVFVSQRTWQRWESGGHAPILGLIKLFCILNGLDFDEHREDLKLPPLEPQVIIQDITEDVLLKKLQDMKCDFTPMHKIRPEFPTLSTERFDEMMRSLRAQGFIEMNFLQEGQDYTKEEINQGIKAYPNYTIFFVTLKQNSPHLPA